MLEGLPVDVWAMDEGTLFGPHQPVLVIEGTYVEWAEYETALLGLLCQASGIATKAARCKRAAGERQVISFGARRMHPALAPMIERNAFIGGCDGVAVTKSAELIDADPTGTIPHSLVLLFGDTVQALAAFNEVVDQKVRRVALIDTLQDEKFEAIRVAEALGKDLYAVRLDTPSSRRGDFFQILSEVRWELDIRGFEHVKILASGGIDEYEILKLNPLVDGYGVGTSIANAPVLSFALDIMEIEGRPMAKRGKRSGAKQVWRVPGTIDNIVLAAGKPAPVGADGRPAESLLKPLIAGGQDRARPAAAADAPGVRARADGGDRHRRRPGAWPARRLLMSGGGVLDEILSHKRSELAARRSHVSMGELQARCRRLAPALDFEAALRPRAGERVRLIAEVKKASPSAGVLNAALDPVTQARAYAGAGAAAISVLTDEKYFRGSLDDLVARPGGRVRPAAAKGVHRRRVPALGVPRRRRRRRAAHRGRARPGAPPRPDAGRQGRSASRRSSRCTTAAELDAALRADAPVIGVNNRDLRTLRTSLEPSLALLPLIPPGHVAVSESGIASGADVERVLAAGAHAILVGEGLVRAPDVSAKVRELLLA